MSPTSLPLFDLTGKVAVVTGGNRGIGLGMARGLARAGADIALWARDESRNAEAAEELRALGVRVESLACDVSHEADVVERAHGCGIPVHSDAVQAVGHLEVDFGASGLDALSLIFGRVCRYW